MFIIHLAIILYYMRRWKIAIVGWDIFLFSPSLSLLSSLHSFLVSSDINYYWWWETRNVFIWDNIWRMREHRHGAFVTYTWKRRLTWKESAFEDTTIPLWKNKCRGSITKKTVTKAVPLFFLGFRYSLEMEEIQRNNVSDTRILQSTTRHVWMS